MLIGSNANPYKKLLEAKKTEEYYESLMKELLSFFEKERDYAHEYVSSFEYIVERNYEYLCLELIRHTPILSYNIEQEFSELVEKYDYINTYTLANLINDFITENIKKSFDDDDLPLQDEFVFIENDEINDYYTIGYFTSGTDEDSRDYQPTTEIEIDGETKFLFDVIREIPEKYIKKYYKEYFKYTDVKLNDFLEVKSDPNLNYLNILYSDVGD